MNVDFCDCFGRKKLNPIANEIRYLIESIQHVIGSKYTRERKIIDKTECMKQKNKSSITDYYL